MIEFKEITKRHNEASSVLEDIKDQITPEQYKALKACQQDVEWNLKMKPGEDTGDTMGRLVSDYFNGYNHTNVLVKYLTRYTHRSVQSDVFKFVLKLIKTYATYPDNMFDVRNQWVQKYAKEFSEIELMKYEQPAQ